jgi:hypothetical protein
VVVVADHVGREPIPEEVPVALVAPVEVVRITAVEAVHRERQVGVRAAEQQVVVGAHQAVTQARDVELAERALQEPQEDAPVALVRKERALCDRPPGHVPDPVGEQISRPSRHRSRS